MHISWTFIDKYKATVEAVEARPGMHFVVEHTPEEMQKVRSQMTTASSPNYSGMPHVHNPKSGEDRMLAGIDKLNLMEERYNQALEYLEWFEPAWEKLSEDDRYVLEKFFIDDDPDTVEELSEYFHIERSSVYVKRKRAVSKLSALLYGKN